MYTDFPLLPKTHTGYGLNDGEREIDASSVLARMFYVLCCQEPEPAPTVSLLGAALGGGGGAFRSTNMYMPNVHAIAAVHPARMSDG